MGGDLRVTGCPTLDILAGHQRPVLREFACANTVLAFDYDGTLAPIVSSPDRAHMHVSTRKLLRDVARRYPTIAVSGRARHDVAARLRGLPLRLVFGNHGGEPPLHRPPTRVRQWVRLLRKRLADAPGIVLEDKVYTLAIHYRRARNKAAALARIQAAVQELRGVRVLGGVEAIALLPDPGPDKGVALQRARRLLGCDRVVYVGDDETDEVAFRSDRATRLLAVKVGKVEASAARYHLARQEDIDRLLQVFLEFRSTRGIAPLSPRGVRRA
jgi:trehalose 6-phosphate phosphatase